MPRADFRFAFAKRVRYAECDPQGVVSDAGIHAKLPWADVVKVDDPNAPDQSRESGADMSLNEMGLGTGDDILSRDDDDFPALATPAGPVTVRLTEKVPAA